MTDKLHTYCELPTSPDNGVKNCRAWHEDYPSQTGFASTRQGAIKSLADQLLNVHFEEWALSRCDEIGDLPLIDDDYPDLQDEFMMELGIEL